MTQAAIFCCAMTMAVFTACSENDDNLAPGVDKMIVGNWFSDVSGMTYAKWNYGKTWQNTKFNADGTGSTRIYYTMDDKAIGCEKIDFTYKASADGVLTMTPTDRDVMTAQWQVVGDELRFGDGDDIDLSFKKTTSDMVAKFDTWSKTDGMIDVPGKYEIKNPTRGVMSDEWVDGEWMDMYQMYDAMKAAGIDHFNTLMFHNCYMGNIETLTQARSFADYIFASAHALSSNGELMTEFVRGLVETGDPVKAGGLMFERCTPKWQNSYLDEAEGMIANGDYKMIRTDKFEPIVDAAKQLCDRLLALYPTQKEAIDRATKSVYRVEGIRDEGNMKYEWEKPFFDIANYAQLLAKETGDAELKTISATLDNAFKEAFIHYRDVNYSKEHLDHYTLSVCLLNHKYYTHDYKTRMPELGALNNYNEGYEKCDFHKLTGWGKWLDTNEQDLGNNPQKGGGDIIL